MPKWARSAPREAIDAYTYMACKLSLVLCLALCKFQIGSQGKINFHLCHLSIKHL